MLQLIEHQSGYLAGASSAPMIRPLTNGDKAEAMYFLSRRPQQTFLMSGWITDNGIENSLNRGRFYGSRNLRGQLEGVALIGHVTLFETKEEPALAAFAGLAQSCAKSHTLIGQPEQIRQFLHYYDCERSAPRNVRRELLFERKSQQQLEESVSGLRPATPSELELVVSVHAEMALRENGANPLEADPNGFRLRCARRIHQDRVWVIVEDNQLIFKADVICDLPEVTYLEGVYVSPDKRNQGFGAHCMRQLTNVLLQRSKSVCVLIREQNLAAQGCYKKAGYTMREYYETLFLQ